MSALSLITAKRSTALPSLLLQQQSIRNFGSTSKILATAKAAETQDDPQIGDYPSVKKENLQTRKWSPKWWDPQEKRNFGEALHPEDDTLSVWAPDYHSTPPRSAVFQFGIAAAVAASFAALVYATKVDRPALPRTYPREGLAEELGGPQAAAAAEGSFDNEGEDEEDDE